MSTLAAMAVNLQVREERHDWHLLHVLPRGKIFAPAIHEENVANWPRAAKISGSPLRPRRLDPKLGRENWRADERSLCAAIAEESAQDSQYLISLSI